MKMSAGTFGGSLAVLAACAVANGQIPGFFQTGAGTRLYGVSANGSVIAGTDVSGSQAVAFTWTQAGGRTNFGTGPGFPANNGAAAISGDAATVVGGTANRAFRYRGPGTYQEIAPVGGYTASTATDVSDDGNVVVGRFFVPQSTAAVAFRWTPQDGVQSLGVARPGDASSSITAISRDGLTLVGGSGAGILPDAAIVWRQGTGMTVLSSLPGALSTGAWGVNSDGSIIVGQSATNAVMWQNGVMTNLGAPTGWVGGEAFAVSDAGTVIVGHTFQAGALQAASVWTPSFGMELLSTYLARNGVEVPSDWTLLKATTVSADGLTIAGWGSNAQSASEGFVVTIPAPSALTLGALVAVPLAARRRRRIARCSR